MKIITVESLTKILQRHGFDNYMMDLMHALKRDFGRWQSFTKIPRPAMHVPGGVLELMPICDNKLYYTFKYVNCHPKNPLTGKQTVIATGQLSRIDTGYPLMFSEMTILTALRTAATSALATDLMARKNAHVLAIIGTGAQSEFQEQGTQLVRDIKEVRYFDIDPKAMDKFEKNIRNKHLKLVRCRNAQEAKELVCAELYELINGSKKGRVNDQEMTLFDSVGIALEDYSALRLTYELAEKYNIGEERNLTPVLKDPKDLISASRMSGNHRVLISNPEDFK